MTSCEMQLNICTLYIVNCTLQKGVCVLKFALGTANPGKVREMCDILCGLGFEVATRDELGIDIDIEETGSTFLENATLKAEAICKASGLPAIADDSGLCIDALGGAPGVYSSSFGGEGLSELERCGFLLNKMANMEHRGAKFVSTIVCVFPDGKVLSAEGECRGEILKVPRGHGGFGYDPVFIAEGMDKAMAELTPEMKNAISHRGKALAKFSELIIQLS